MTRDDPRRTPWPPLPRMVVSSSGPPDPPPGSEPPRPIPGGRACPGCGAEVPDGFKVCQCGNRCGGLERPAAADREPPPPVDRLWPSDAASHDEMLASIDGVLGFAPLSQWWRAVAARPGNLLDNLRDCARRAGEAP